jgi:hypothetical protein
MEKNIVAMFDRRAQAETAIRALLDDGIPAERIGMVAGDAREEAKRAKRADAGEAAGAAVVGAAAGIAGLTALAVPGIGTALLAGAAATLGAAGAAGAEQEKAEAQLLDVLRRAGLTAEQAPVYADDVQRGRTVVAVQAEEKQTDRIHELFRSHGSTNIEFRRLA